jgi:preprotein translocase subunit YajC
MRENYMKLHILAATAALALAGGSVPVLAQEGVAVGTTIYGSDGAQVGTVERIDGPNVLLNTGSVTAALPATTIGKGENGPVIGWTKTELEAAVNQANQEAAAKLAAALIEGAEVYSSDNVLLGKVTSIEENLVVIELASGPASLPKNQIALQTDKVTFLATAADLQAAVAAQGGD